MYYFRKCVDGDWKEYKFDAEDVEKTLVLAITKCVEVKAKILQVAPVVAKKLGIELTQTDLSDIFDKVGPTYGELAIDVLSKRLAEAKGQEKAQQ